MLLEISRVLSSHPRQLFQVARSLLWRHGFVDHAKDREKHPEVLAKAPISTRAQVMSGGYSSDG